ISLRRHARLMDYHVHNGCNARAWIAIDTKTDIDLDLANVAFITGFPHIPAGSGRVVRSTDLDPVPRSRYDWLEPVRACAGATMHLRAAHSTICFYTWGDHECSLPTGATRATLIDDARLLSLNAGDVLILAEQIGPTTGNRADADPTHRHAVRLTKV